MKFKQSVKVKNILLLKFIRFTWTPVSVMLKTSKQNPIISGDKECMYGKRKKKIIMEKMESSLSDVDSGPGIYCDF